MNNDDRMFLLRVLEVGKVSAPMFRNPSDLTELARNLLVAECKRISTQSNVVYTADEYGYPVATFLAQSAQGRPHPASAGNTVASGPLSPTQVPSSSPLAPATSTTPEQSCQPVPTESALPLETIQVSQP